MIRSKGVSAAALALVALTAGAAAYWVAMPRAVELSPLVPAPVRAVSPPVASGGGHLAQPTTGPAHIRVHRLAPVAAPPTQPYPLVATAPAKPAAIPSVAPAPATATADPAATAAALSSLADDSTDKRPLTPEEQNEEQKEQDSASREADQVRFVFRAHLPQVRACYERAFKGADSPPGGRVEIGLTITAQGRATEVHVESNTTGSESLGTCICGRVADWTFPKPVAGDYALTYPFMFAKGA